MKRMRKPSPAVVVASVALFVALGGGAYAGVALNQVRSANIKNGEVKTADLGNFAVTSLKIANSSVKSNKLRAGAVGTAALTDGGVANADIAAGAVTPAKIAGVPTARVGNNANVAVPGNAAFTVIPMNAETFDATAMHRTDVDTSRITVATAGVYVVTTHITWEANQVGARELNLRKNGTVVVARAVQDGNGAGNTTDQSLTTLVQLNAGDFVETVVRQNSGSPLNVLTTDDFSPRLAAAWMSPS